MKKLSMSLLLLAIMILSISVVSATDAEVSADLASAPDDAAISAADDASILGNPTRTFAMLQDEIDDPSCDGNITLEANYLRDVADQSAIRIWNKDVKITGAADHDTIDANGLGRIFEVSNGHKLTLEGINLKNGLTDVNSGYDGNGGAIYIESGVLEINNVNFTNNTANHKGGVIYSNGGQLTLTGSTFNGSDLTNRRSGDGGAAIYVNGGTVTITKCEVTNNLKDIVRRGGYDATDDLCTGAITTSGDSTLNIYDSYFSKNSGSYGGAITCDDNSVLYVRNTTFEDNFAFNGGAIDFDGVSYTITNCTFKDNQARGTGSNENNYASGGAICTFNKDSISLIEDCIFENNTAADGGAIIAENAQVTRCNFTNNMASSTYSETYKGNPNNKGGNGGAIAITNNKTDSASNIDCAINITDSNFINNSGTGNYWGIYLRNSISEIRGSSFTDTVIDNGPYSTLTISGNTFDNDGYTSENYDIRAANSNIILNVNNMPKIKSGNIYGDITNFTDLQKWIDETNYDLDLINDITKLDTEFDTFADGVVISRNIWIDAHGHTISSSSGKVFTTNSDAKLELNNANVVGDGTSPIVNNGQVSLNKNNPNTFSNYGQYAIDNKGTLTIGTTITTFTELNYLIGLVNGGIVYISTSKITKAVDERDVFKNGIVIDKDLTIGGNINTKHIIRNYINANGDGRIFNVTNGATLTLQNTNITNGNSVEGAGIYVDESSTLNVDTVNFVNNVAEKKGGAIYSAGTVNINHTVFDSNDITTRDGGESDHYGGAAIYVVGNTLTVDESTFRRNILNYNPGAGSQHCDAVWGAITTEDTTSIKINNSKFEDNSGCYGADISVFNRSGTVTPVLSIDNCNFTGSETYAGAVHIEDTEFTINNSNFDNCIADAIGSTGYNAAGGAIYATRSEGTIKYSNFTNCGNPNSVGKTQGGAIGVDNMVSLLVEGCTFDNNTAYIERGGAICIVDPDGDTTIKSTVFINNKAAGSSGAGAGAVYFGVRDASGAKLTVDECNFENNTAEISAGGAIYVLINPAGSTGNVEIINSNFTNNVVNTNSGGAIRFFSAESSNELNITGSRFEENKAPGSSGAGGAVYLDNGNFRVKDSTFIDNTATTNGNAIFAKNGKLTLNNNSVIGTSADYVGIYLTANAKANINVTVLDNETKNINSAEAELYAIITDDNGNLIKDNGQFNFTINNEGVPATYEDGSYKATYTLPAVGIYTVGMNSTKYANLNVVNGSIWFKANSSVTVNDVDNAVYGNNITVTFTIPIDGNATGVKNAVIYNADGQPVTADININNTAQTITIAAGLNAGTYTLNVTTIPINENYLSVNESATIVIGKADSNVTVPAYTEVAYGGIVVVTVSDLVNASGVDAKLYNGDAEVTGAVSVSGNDITVNVLGLSFGTYTLNVTTVTDANHANVTKSSIINVTGKGTPNLGVEDITPITYGVASISIVANYTGNYNITVDDGDVINVDNIVAGEAKTVSIGVLAAGSHTVKVQFKGDDNYNPSNVVSKDLTVKPATATITLSGTTSIIYGQNTTITATTTHAKAITAKLDGNNVPVSGFNVTVAPGAGSHNLTVTTVPENSNYTSSSDNLTIVVAKATSSVSVPVVSFIYGGSQTVTVTVVNSTGAIHAQLLNSSGRPVIVGNATVKGKEVTVSGLPVGYYTLVVTVDADDNYESATGDNIVIVNAKSTSNVTVPPISFDYGESGTVTVTVTGTTGAIHAQLLDTNGTPLTIGKAIVNGKKVTVSDLPVGNYILNVTADADDRYEGASGNNSVVVSKAPSSVVINNIIDGAYKTVAANVDYTVTNRTTVTFKISNKTSVVVNETAIDQLEAKLFGLNIGNYTITIINAENDNYYGDEDSGNFTVTKGYVNMAITSKDVVYPNDVVVTVISDVSGNYSLFKGITSPKYIVLEAGVAQEVNFTDMDAGTYEFALVYLETEYYNTGRKAVNVTVDKANVNMAITSKDVVYPNDVVVTVMSDVSGNYSLYLDTTSPKNIVLEAGVAQEVNFSKVDAGTHEFTLAYLETQNYKAANKSVSVNIAKGNVNMTITAKDVIYPNDVVLTLLSDVSGNYSLYKGITAPQYIDLEAGVAKEVKFSKLDVDTYEFTLVYFETQNYKTSMESVNVDVSKGNVTINISASDVTYPDDIILNLLSDVSGTYDLYLGSVAPFKINLEAGVVKTLECAEFEAGTHEFTLAYLGSTNYNPARESINVTVSKGNVNMNITAKDVTYPDDVVLTLLSDVSGNYSLFKGITSPQYVVLEAGVAKEVKFSKLDAGTYEFALVYLETENYTTGRTAINVTVNKVENTTMSVNVTTPVATENATVTVTLPADATGNVSVKYGNGVYFADVVNGTAVVSVPTTVAGTETADVIYSGDNNYGSVSSEVNITVKVQGVIIAENIKRGVNSSYDYYATLVNAEGQPISDVEITFTIEGKTYKAKTNASGIATVSAGLVVKDGKDTVYNVTVTNPYTFENTTATTTIVPRLIVVSGDLTADYLENPPYIVQAIGDDGEHVGANVTVRIVFAGFYYDLQTNATGHVVRTIALAPGSYAVRGEYLGYKTEQTPFQVLQILQASSGTLKKKTAKTYTLKATLKHSNGKAIANAEVKLNFNGKNYKVKTNSKGVASYTLKSSQISKLQAGKTYILKALYINDWTKGKWQGKIKVVNK